MKLAELNMQYDSSCSKPHCVEWYWGHEVLKNLIVMFSNDETLTVHMV